MLKHIIPAIALLLAPTIADARPSHHYARHATVHHYYGPAYGRHYRNVDGNMAHSPMRASSRPAGASAHCGDGSWSFSQHARGTCSHHGGVASW